MYRKQTRPQVMGRSTCALEAAPFHATVSDRGGFCARQAALLVLAAAWLAVGAPGRAATLTSHWTLDEGTGQTVGDSAASFDGTRGATGSAASDDPAWTSSAKIGANALSFDGTNDYVFFDDVLDQGSADFTTSLWFNLSSSASTTLNHRLFQKRGTGSLGTAAGWSITVRHSGTDVIVFSSIWDDGGGDSHFISDSGGDEPSFVIGTAGDWIHLVTVFDNSNDKWIWYADGDEVQNFSVSSAIGSVDNGRPLTFGAAADPATQQFLNGLLDDAGLFSGTLSATEVKAIYTLGDDTDPLGNGADLNYDLGMAQALFDLHAAGSGSVVIDGLTWYYRGGLTTAPGELTKIGGEYFLALSGLGTGVSTVPVPEPTGVLLLTMGLALLAGGRRFRRRCIG